MNEPSMLKNFPLLTPSKNFKSWKGQILLNAHSVYVEIFCPNIPQLDNLKVHIPEFEDFKFHQFDLKETIEIIKKKTNSLSELVEELISVLVKIRKHDLFSSVQNLGDIIYTNEKFYDVIQEVNIYGQYVHAIDEKLKHVIFNVPDICKRNHFITIFIPEKYTMFKKQSLHFETMIPSNTMVSFIKVNTISKLFEEFKSVLNKLDNFWNVHEEIINTCNAIGSYTFKDVNYRIPIDSHVYVEVEIDPFNPYSCPKFDLHGRSEHLKQFQLRLNEMNAILIWNAENNFKENILNVFNISDLYSQYEEDEGHVVECSDSSNCCFICYDELNTTVKKQIKTCVNEKCDALYHMSCICEWLLNSGSAPMFEHLQGKCPQCDEEILVALENFDLIKT